ncbi:2-oxo-4-hydroxy-4-carboxy-5-ureidoimidazoline decarboxylase [Saccharopolyspora elongata]|uniref:2-oxo-4-hydroxy-4-carboxy-5-ureidoimidazoline decarboxylase n=1 Tax=Saccharopolyspora elongata TaxID=2530387 RepID=UPI001404B615|nr:2-oxo-4-hydroxy-4-carboxy-5-ureidoimidazoline decarboxylase [Saccharopolyspora elongata]
MSGIAILNALSADAARDALGACCPSARWSRDLAALRPFPSESALIVAGTGLLDGMPDAELVEVISRHDPIGVDPGEDRVTGRWSRREQSGVLGGDAAVREEFAELNRRYRERFGYVYLVYATGLSAAGIRDDLVRRLRQDEADELRTARAELRKIVELRLGRILEAVR